MTVDDQIVHALFETDALRISPSDQPFFYTSGTIGPYYINTHFLFGSEAEANSLLALIETAVHEPQSLSAALWPRIDQQYKENRIFRLVIDSLCARASAMPHDFVSGGERRDYFFSLPVASLLGKPHLGILKTGEAWLCRTVGEPERAVTAGALAGQAALHVSDLVTEASSYTRTWIPTVQRAGASMPHTLTVVDRDQGGARALTGAGTALHALTVFSADLFQSARAAGLITPAQLKQVLQFLQDPGAFQKTFLEEHPEFLDEQIRQGGKNAERARLLKERLHGA